MREKKRQRLAQEQEQLVRLARREAAAHCLRAAACRILERRRGEKQRQRLAKEQAPTRSEIGAAFQAQPTLLGAREAEEPSRGWFMGVQEVMESKRVRVDSEPGAMRALPQKARWMIQVAAFQAKPKLPGQLFRFSGAGSLGCAWNIAGCNISRALQQETYTHSLSCLRRWTRVRAERLRTGA